MSDMKFYVYQFIDNKDQNKAITTIWLENYAEMLHLIQIDNEWFGVIPSGSVHICTYGQTALDMQGTNNENKNIYPFGYACEEQAKLFNRLKNNPASFVPPINFFKMIGLNSQTFTEFQSVTISCCFTESPFVTFDFLDSPLEDLIELYEEEQPLANVQIFTIAPNHFQWVGAIENTLNGFHQLMGCTLMAIANYPNITPNQTYKLMQQFFNTKNWHCFL